jgi:hypothetical protein
LTKKVEGVGRRQQVKVGQIRPRVAGVHLEVPLPQRSACLSLDNPIFITEG